MLCYSKLSETVVMEQKMVRDNAHATGNCQKQVTCYTRQSENLNMLSKLLETEDMLQKTIIG